MPQEQSTFGRVLDLFGRPGAATAGVVRSLAREEGLGTAWDRFWKNLKGERRDDFGDVLQDAGMKSGWGRTGLGFVGDVVLDPLNLVGGVAFKGARAIGGFTGNALRKIPAVDDLARGFNQAFVPYANLPTEYGELRRRFDVMQSAIPEVVREDITKAMRGKGLGQEDFRQLPFVLEASAKPANPAQEAAEQWWRQQFNQTYQKEAGLGLHRADTFRDDYTPVVYRDRGHGGGLLERFLPQSNIKAKLPAAKVRTTRNFTEALAKGADPSIVSAGFTRLATGRQAANTAEFMRDTLSRFGQEGASAPAEWVKLERRGSIADRPFWEQPLQLASGQTVRLGDVAVDPAIARDMSRFFVAEKKNPWLDAYDRFTNIFRGMATVYKPSLAFPMTNFQGNVWNSAIGGYYGGLGAIRNISRTRQNDLFKTVPGMTPDEVADAVKKFGIRNPMTSVVGDLGPQKLEQEILWSQLPRREQVRQRLLHPIQSYASGMRGLNSRLEEASKVGFFVNSLKKNPTLPTDQRVWDAYKDTATHLFNYQELTPFERNVMRRMMPFYTFSRKNLPLQVRALVQHPGLIAGVSKAKNELEQLAEQRGQNVPIVDRPKWLQEVQAIGLPTLPEWIAGKPERGARQFYTPYLPVQDLNKIPFPTGSSLTDVLSETGSMLNPLAKMPLEVGLNRSFFTDRPLFDADLGFSGDYQTAQFPFSVLPSGTPGVRTVGRGKAKETQVPVVANYTAQNLLPIFSTLSRMVPALGPERLAKRPEISGLTDMFGLRIHERRADQIKKDREDARATERRTRTKERNQRDRDSDSFYKSLVDILRGRR